MIPGPTIEELDLINGNFICGVVEGFYGRPWTAEQKKILFKRMKKLGMNTYLYAPKNDSKHRMYWRELYSVEEAENLTNLIEAAHSNNVTFVYALSPGLDITFSNSKEVTQLKRKLEQVSSFGCKAFALLFDDIDVDMCEADKEFFQSFAHAQVSVTNEVYQHLGQCKFMFCPTEYCASRAVPSVSQSEYLSTLGAKLLPDIDVMWTGPTVVAKNITIASIEELSKVIKRPPLIWDNIHANDYDQRRLFLGPYEGRAPELIPYLRGVLTNPNCEFEANYIAMHSLSEWCKSNIDGIKQDVVLCSSPVDADIRLENEDTPEDIPSSATALYQPRQALVSAVNSWLVDVLQERSGPAKKHISPVQAQTALAPTPDPVVNTCTAVSTTTISQTTSSPLPIATCPIPIPLKSVTDSESLECNSYSQPVPCINPVNSLIESCASDSDEDVSEKFEPMDCNVSPGSTPPCAHESSVVAIPESVIEVEKDPPSDIMDTEIVDSKSEDSFTAPSTTQLGISVLSSITTTQNLLDVDDVKLLVDLFYLPFEHGNKGVNILKELHWVKSNAHFVRAVSDSSGPSTPKASDAEEWNRHARLLQESISEVSQMIDRICNINNQFVVYDLFPYLWDLKGMLSLASVFVSWLGSNKAYRDAFTSGDQEPWVFRGGLQAEIQHLLPLDQATDLAMFVVPQTPTPTMFNIRPYIPSDEEKVYEICRRTCDDGADGTEIFPDHPNIISDKLVGAFVTISPEYCFVLEDSEGICGYALAALDAKLFYQKAEVAWYNFLKEKYPKPETSNGLSPAEEVIVSIHNHEAPVSEKIIQTHPSVMRMNLLPRGYTDVSACRRLFTAAVMALKANGSHGVFTECSVGDRYTTDFYTKLGFFNVDCGTDISEDVTIMGRVF